MSARAKRAAQVARASAMTPAELSLAVNDIHNHALRLGHGVARCGMSCTVNDVDGKPVTIGSLAEKACPKC